MYAYTKFATVDKDFNFLECLLFGALISATDPGIVLHSYSHCTSRENSIKHQVIFIFGDHILYSPDLYV